MSNNNDVQAVYGNINLETLRKAQETIEAAIPRALQILQDRNKATQGESQTAAPAYTPVQLFVEELVSVEPTSTSKATTEVGYATWLVGTEHSGVFYGKQQSSSDLLKDDQVLVVRLEHCRSTTLPEPFREFKGYTFSTEVDVLPNKCYQLHLKPFEELCAATQAAILDALDKCHTALHGA